MQAHVEALAAAMDMRDRRTARHSEDVVRLAVIVGQVLDLEPASLLELEFAARLHDVGKIRVPDAVLNKPGPLDEQEYQVIRCHSAWGAETLASDPPASRLSPLWSASTTSAGTAPATPTASAARASRWPAGSSAPATRSRR